LIERTDIPSSNRLQLAVVCAASFVVWVGFGAILPYLPVFLKEQAHASLSLIGVIAAAYYVGTLSFSALLGRLSDKIGRKPLLVLGAWLYAGATALFVTTTHPAWFILFRFLEGVGAAAVGPAGQAFVADITTNEVRSRAYGWLTTAQFGGLVAGPAVAGLLYSLGGGQGVWAFRTIFLFGSALSALTAVALMVAIKEPRSSAERAASLTKRPSYRRLVTRPILAFLVVAATGHFAMGTWEVLWSLWLRRLGASMQFVSWTFVAFSLPMLFSWIGGRLADRYSRFYLMFAGYAFSAVAWIVYGAARNLTLFIMFNVLEGLAVALSFPAKQAFLVQVAPPRWLGTVQGLESTTMMGAALVGTLLAPVLYTYISGYVIGVGGILALAGLAYAGPILRREWARVSRSEEASPLAVLGHSPEAGAKNLAAPEEA
jgi:MFS family permease